MHMHLLPQHINPDYKPSNKLQVHHCSALQFFCLLIVFQSEQQMKDLYIQFRGRESIEDNCKSVVDHVVREYGRIDILVNNAAVQHYSTTLEEVTEAWLERLFRTNIFGYFFLNKHCLKHMKAGSCVINSTSIAAYGGSAELLDYSSTEGATVVLLSMLDIACCSFGSPWKYGLLQK
ncbi:hypothetical protein Peur_024927 [Populus x canadensis]